MIFRVFYTVVFLFFLFPKIGEGQNLFPRRASDAIVLSGSQLSQFVGKEINHIVAYQYNDEQGWKIIPFQIDEKDSVSANKIYGKINPRECINDEWCSSLDNLKLLTYTDENTFTGTDSDPSFDQNDELVFMVQDAAYPEPENSSPEGVIKESGMEISIVDPIDDSQAFVYLFLKRKEQKPPAKPTQSYVNYEFILKSGGYKNTYANERGPNPEQSTVSTPFYKMGFSERWIKDEIRILAGLSSGVNILDRHKVLFAPDVCERHEGTFSIGEGAFIVNKSGPIRAIRSYMGANSGPLTQREHIFYQQKEVINTWLRVHPIQSIMDFYDYSTLAEGMEYTNSNNPSAVIIDGTPDNLKEGKIDWELVSGEQGTMYIEHQFNTSATSLLESNYYLDDRFPEDPQCTGDDFAIGASGIWIKTPIPNTDIRLDGRPAEFKLTRTNYFSAPDPNINIPELHAMNQENPLKVRIHTLDQERELFKIYPNPFSGELNIETENKSGIASVFMWSLLGKLVYNGSFSDTDTIKIVTHGLPAGFYIIMVETDSGIRKNIKLLKN